MGIWISDFFEKWEDGVCWAHGPPEPQDAGLELLLPLPVFMLPEMRQAHSRPTTDTSSYLFCSNLSYFLPTQLSPLRTWGREWGRGEEKVGKGRDMEGSRGWVGRELSGCCLSLEPGPPLCPCTGS